MGPKTRDDVVFRRLGDEFAILDPSGNVIHVLNAAAAAVWVLCDGTRDTQDISVEVCRAFSLADDADLEEDVREALAVFAEKGLLA